LPFYFAFDRGKRPKGVFSSEDSLPAAQPGVSGNGLSGLVMPAT